MKRGAALLLCAPLAAAAQEPADGVPPPRPIAGLRGVHTISRVVFADAPDDPHELELVLFFPDRARWTLSREGSDERIVVYRRGCEIHHLQGAPPARALAGEEADAFLRSLELRRALLLFPEGFAWKGEGAERTAQVEGTAEGPDGAPSVAGAITVVLDGEDRPASAAVAAPHGSVQETIRVRAWREHDGRAFPARLVLEAGGEPLWEEELVSATTAVRFLDAAFLPPGRRAELAERPEGPPDVPLELRLAAHVSRALPLPEESGWEEARAAEREARAAAAEQGLDLDPVPTFRVADDGRPAAVLLRLARRDAEPPEGWRRVPDRDGLALVLGELPTADAVGRLRAAIPAGMRADRPYVRLYGSAEVGERVELALPLRPL